MESNPARETALRVKLGIPADARQVLLFAETSHWDPNWLRTSQEYYQGLVEPGLDQVVKELRADEKRVFSIECMFFLRLYYEAHPDLQDELRLLLNDRRLRLTGSGVTTPDTLVPSAEAILRDLLIGQEWLRSIGVTQEPSLAYFPDCFGHTPNLPALLNAAGFTRTAVTRIDGMWFLSADLDLPRHFPIEGSSAELLLKQERSLDFTWRSPDGSALSCHWNAFTYGQGDMLADAGLARVYLYPRFSRPNRSEKLVSRRVNEILRQLTPYSRTPYLFCPIGWDFNPPIPAINELLERYNRTVYPSSGVWLLNAGLDDYFDLLDCHRQRLPDLQLDPNPYWTGFYTSRPGLKQRAFKLWEQLSLAERLSLLSGRPDLAPQPGERAWWSAAVSNHHDLITGTSPDRVAQGEQIPMIDAALQEVAAAIEPLKKGISLPQSAQGPAPEPVYREEADGLVIVTALYELALSSQAGGRIESLRLAETGETLFKEPSHAVLQYNESGGLWRMGYEYRGGRFREAALRLPPARIEVTKAGGYLKVSWRSELPGALLNQSLWLAQQDPLIYFEVEGLAAQKTTLALRYNLPFSPDQLEMEAPGGKVTRPLAKVYRRPFWPAQRYLIIPNPSGGRGFALLLRHTGAVSCSEDGQVEAVILRNAIRERAYFARISLLGMPATGIETERTAFRGALAFPRHGEETMLSRQSRALLDAPFASSEDRLLALATRELVEVVEGTAFVSAIKPAWRGEGVIVRLEIPDAPQPPERLRLRALPARSAWLVDARERDLRPVEIDRGEITLPAERSIVTLRLL